MDIKKLEFRYIGWLSEPIGLVFRKPNGETVQFLSAKRGNIAYEHRVLKRLSYVDEVFGNYHINDRKSPFLFLSLTLNHDEPLENEWLNIGVKFNLFKQKLQRILGNLEVIRCWEAQQNGYPHIHVLIKMNHAVQYWRQMVKKRVIYRIDSDIMVNMIKQCWGRVTQRSWNPDKRIVKSWGFVDVQTFINGNYAVGYVLKYIQKMSEKDSLNPKSKLNFALQWHFKKRAFSISQSLRKKCDLIRETLHNSNLNPSLPSGKYEFLGISTKTGFVPKSEFHKRVKKTVYYSVRSVSCLYRRFNYCRAQHNISRMARGSQNWLS